MTVNYEYGKFDRFIHWLMVINISATLIFSKGMSSLADAQKVNEYGDHGLSVTTIFICLMIRIAWRATHGFAALPQGMPTWQKRAAKAMHYLLYIAIFTQICIGVLLASTTDNDFVAKGYGINYSSFNLVEDGFHDNLLSIHIGMYWLIISLIVVHAGAAIKHHFVDKDDVLLRMLPFIRRP